MNNYLVLLYYNLKGELYAVGYFFPLLLKNAYHRRWRVR